MKFYFILFISGIISMLFTGCDSASNDDTIVASHLDTTLNKDGFSYANINKIRTKHLD